MLQRFNHADLGCVTIRPVVLLRSSTGFANGSNPPYVILGIGLLSKPTGARLMLRYDPLTTPALFSTGRIRKR